MGVVASGSHHWGERVKRVVVALQGPEPLQPPEPPQPPLPPLPPQRRTELVVLSKEVGEMQVVTDHLHV